MRNRDNPARQPSDEDLFVRTRRKLTARYSGMLIAFLGLLVIIVYYSLFFYIYSDQRGRLHRLADEEISLLQSWADQDADPYRRPPQQIEREFRVTPDQSFYYLLVNNGNLNLDDEAVPEWRDPILARIAAGKYGGEGITRIHVLWQSADASGVMRDRTVHFYGTSRELLRQGEPVGTLYIGKDLSFFYNLFKRLSFVLIGLTLIFSALALWLSHRMARRAMVPITEAYRRQFEFSADASHELRTPLSVLLTSIEALQLETAVTRIPFAKSVLDGMKQEVGGMAKLTGELLQLARPDADTIDMNYVPFDVGQSANDTIERLRPAARTKNIALGLHVRGPLTAHWDEERFRQLLVLLVDNAIAYTPEGGEVGVTISDRMEQETRDLVIEVKDTGIGIAPDALPRIFDRFYRQDKSRARQSGGHGLGLAIAKKIADAGRGTIHVDSTVGAGSTFTVRIPL